MRSVIQLIKLHKYYDILQKRHGAASLCPIYGAGCITAPKVMLVFMNPTGKNVSANKEWQGMRAPWLGTKNIWSLLVRVGIVSMNTGSLIQGKKPGEWTPKFTREVYQEINASSVFVTNLAKCTQLDARPLPDSVFREYRSLMLQEIELISPKNIITFGNQVSSVLLEKKISVSRYLGAAHEELAVNNKLFQIYPTYYPVGQGLRNMPLAVARINKILKITV